MGNKEKYILSMSKEQAEILSEACEFYSRVVMGQWLRICETTLDWSSRDFEQCLKDRDKIEELLMEARALTYPMLGKNEGCSYGVGHFKNADMAYEIHQVIRNTTAWYNNPEGGCTINFSTPMSFSGEKLPKCKIINKKGEKSNVLLDFRPLCNYG